jgi:tetratricopeptide (TPR) repeat protein
MTVRLATHETATGEVVRERVSTGPDVFRVIDDLSVQVRQDLGLPDSRPEGVTDLPVLELLSSSTEAFRALMEGQKAVMRDDWPAAEAAFQRAVELDATFALAHYALFQSRVLRGSTEAAIPALDNAMQHLYRLPERTQFLVKADHYFMRRDMEKAFAVVNMMVELYPDDLQGHLVRSQFQVFRDERDGAVTSLRRVLELDPQQQEVLLQIGDLEEQQGKFADALATYRDYAGRFPDDVSAQLRLARVHGRLGQLDQAAASLDRALLIEPGHVEATTELALLRRNEGKFDDAWRLLGDAGASARTAEDRTRVAAALQEYHEFRGRMRSAVEAMQERVTTAGQWQPPLTVLSLRMSQLGAYVRAGQEAHATAMLEELRGEFRPPLDDYWRLGQLSIAIAARDTAALPEAAEGVRGIMEAFGFRFLEATLARAEATLYEVRGDWEGALAAYQRERALEPTSLTVNRHIARCHRQLGRTAEALSAIEEHLDSTPFSPESNLEAARIKLLTGDAAGARKHLDRAALALAEADAGYPPVDELATLENELETR